MADLVHMIARQGRAYTAALLADAQDPYVELLTLFWGPRFDQEHALALWARFSRRRPLEAASLLPELLSLGEGFDALKRTEKDRLRRLIVRHRALSE